MLKFREMLRPARGHFLTAAKLLSTPPGEGNAETDAATNLVKTPGMLFISVQSVRDCYICVTDERLLLTHTVDALSTASFFAANQHATNYENQNN